MAKYYEGIADYVVKKYGIGPTAKSSLRSELSRIDNNAEKVFDVVVRKVGAARSERDQIIKDWKRAGLVK